MKLTITTLVIVEGSYIQGIFHSLEEHPGKAYQELVDQVENEYGYDADKDHVPLHFKTIQDIKNYFELVHIETQELTANDDQGYESGISMYGHYIACKSLDISSEEEYMNQLTDIELICNEL